MRERAVLDVSLFSTACGKPLNNSGVDGGSAVVDLWGAAVHHFVRVQWQEPELKSVAELRLIGVNRMNWPAPNTERTAGEIPLQTAGSAPHLGGL